MQKEKRSSLKPSTIQDVLNILEKAFNTPAKYIRDMALRRAQKWTRDLMTSNQYIRTLRRKFEDGLAEMSQMKLDVKEKIWAFIDEFLKQKTKEKTGYLL